MQFEVSSQDLQRVRKNAKRTRASVACARCKAAKTKCSGYRPCKRCSDSNVACFFKPGCFESTSQKSKTQSWSEPTFIAPHQSWGKNTPSGFSVTQGSMINHCARGYGHVSGGLGSDFHGKETADFLKSDGSTSSSGDIMERTEKSRIAVLVPQILNPACNIQLCWRMSPTPGEFIWPPTTTNLPDLLETLRSL